MWTQISYEFSPEKKISPTEFEHPSGISEGLQQRSECNDGTRWGLRGWGARGGRGRARALTLGNV